jgi:nitrogen fixation-related uncharacterized protein
MTFKQRLPYFLVGLFIGIIVVVFIWGKKNTTFDYGPNARVLKNISTKHLIYSNNAWNAIENHGIDTSAISEILRTGKVDLWNKVKKDSSILYPIKGRDSLSDLTVFIENREETAIVTEINLN